MEGIGHRPNPRQAADRPPGEARPIGGGREATCREIWKMVDWDGDDVNALLAVLEDWDLILRAEGLDRHPLIRGPRP